MNASKLVVPEARYGVRERGPNGSFKQIRTKAREMGNAAAGSGSPAFREAASVQDTATVR